MVSKIRNATDKSGQGDAPGEVTSDTALHWVHWYTGYTGALGAVVHWVQWYAGTLGAVSKVVLLVLVLVLYQSHYHRHITHQTESVAMGLFTRMAHTMFTRTVKGTGVLLLDQGIFNTQQQ